MQNTQPLKLPFSLLALDILGTVFLMFGIAKLFIGKDFLAEFFQFELSGLMLIIIGVLLMLPFALNIFSQIRTYKEQQLNK